MNIPSTGRNSQKAKFFLEVSVAFEFLALFHSLNEEKQSELMEILTVFEAKYAGKE